MVLVITFGVVERFYLGALMLLIFVVDFVGVIVGSRLRALPIIC